MSPDRKCGSTLPKCWIAFLEAGAPALLATFLTCFKRSRRMILQCFASRRPCFTTTILRDRCAGFTGRGISATRSGCDSISKLRVTPQYRLKVRLEGSDEHLAV